MPAAANGSSVHASERDSSAAGGHAQPCTPSARPKEYPPIAPKPHAAKSHAYWARAPRGLWSGGRATDVSCAVPRRIAKSVVTQVNLPFNLLQIYMCEVK